MVFLLKMKGIKMKQLVGAIAILFASATVAQDDLDKLLSDLENGSWRATEMVNSDEFRKILSCTNENSDVAEKIKSAIWAHKMAPVYEQMERLQRRVAEAQVEVDAKTLTTEALSELSEPARRYYGKDIAAATNKLASAIQSRDEYKNKRKPEDIAGFAHWKEICAAKEVARKLKEKERREQEQREEELREEVDRVRSRHRRARCELKGDSMCWDGHCYENMSSPDQCNKKIKECNENLNALRANLAGLERMTPERLAQLSSLAQKKYREKLAQCKNEIEKEEYKKTQYESVWVVKKWPSMAEWKKHHDAEEMEKKRKQAEESLADTELRLALMQAAKESDAVYEERETHNRWF